MSIETWKQEFLQHYYPEMTTADCIRQGIRKWEGTTEENLKKHGVVLVDGFVFNGQRSAGAYLGNDNCALCERFYVRGLGCTTCPLLVMRENTPCDEGYAEEGLLDLWGLAAYQGNPEPMIEALEECLEKELENGKD